MTKKMTEADMVYWGLQQFTFAVKFVACCIEKKIDSSLFKPKTIVTIGGDSTIEIPKWTIINQENLVRGAKNQLMTSIGACSIAVDEALKLKYGRIKFTNWQNDQSDLNSLREIIYLIRCAYAHTMPEVHWRISKDRRTAIYTVNTPDGKVQFDANNRNKTKLDPTHFGGLKGYINLVHYASDILRKQ